MPRYLLLARDNTETFERYSPSEMQALVQRYVDWSRRLAEAGHLETSDKLQGDQARVLRGGSVTDGPYAEAKEVVGGFWILNAADLDEAQEMAAGCPHLEFGSLELRAIEELDRG